ncbi:MAG: hypothetical protein HDKAJFGB_03935 [Anaerolineae bacterium]|nr:hypothetical protein [Anaerolineae bacterium]
MSEGWLLSCIAAAIAYFVIAPKGSVDTVVKRGRQFAAIAAVIGTMATLYRFPLPAPRGGKEAVAEWLAVSITIALLAFGIGVLFQFVIASIRVARAKVPRAIDVLKNTTSEVANQFREKTQQSQAQDEYLYGIVAQEMKMSKIDEGLWAKAFSESNGNEPQTKARYIKYRVDQLRRK